MRAYTAFLVAPVLAMALVGCGGEDESDSDVSETDVPADPSSLRVVHASPTAPEVDVWVKELNAAVITGLSYQETSSFIDVPPGNYTIELRLAGAPGTEAAAWSTPLTVPEGETITAVAAGLLGAEDEAEAFRLLPLVHGFASPGENQAAVRIVHASATAPTVDIDLGDDGQAELSGVARWAESGAAGVALPAGQALQIGIRAGGQRVTAFTTPELPAGADLFVVATGLLSDRPSDPAGFGLLAVGPTGTVGLIRQNPVVYALHASPDAPAVDLAAGTAVLGSNLAFGQISGAIQVPPGQYDLALHASPWNGTSAPAFSFQTPALAAGGRYLAIATGFLTSTAPADKFRVLAIAEGFDVADDQAGLRAVHASPDAPTVDIGTVDAGRVTPLAPFTAVPFGAASAEGGVSLAPGSYDLGVAITGEASPVFTFSDVAVGGGDRLIAVAAGSLGAEDPSRTFRLLAVDVTATPWSVGAILPDPAR